MGCCISSRSFFTIFNPYTHPSKFFERLANEPGFIDEGAKIDACRLLGLHYLNVKQTEKGREYVWRSAQYAHDAGYGAGYVTDMQNELNKR